MYRDCFYSVGASMRRALLIASTTLTLVLGAGLTHASAQAPSPTPSPSTESSPADVQPLTALRTPASPAFTLLGIEPSAVERPATPADFATTLVTQTKEFSTLPKNFALETSPYWLAPHTNLTWDKDSTRNLGESIARTFSASFASAQVPKTTDKTAIGIGIRASIASGQLSEKTRTAIRALQEALHQQGAVFLSLADKRLLELDKAAACDTKPAAEQPKCFADLDALKARVAEQVFASDEFKALVKKLPGLAISREGFMLDVAAAWTWTFTGEDWQTHQFTKGGFWATPAYQGGHWIALGVLRYIRDALNPTDANVVEAGGRAIYTTDAWMASLEYVSRTVKNHPVDGNYRVAVVAEHKMSDTVWLTATFGRDRNRVDSPGSLLAQLGVSFHLSHDRYKF